MKLKKILTWVGFLIIFFLLLIYYFFHKEQFQITTTNKDDPMYILDKFCNKHFGDDWGVDSVYHYNDKITFIIIHTRDVVIDLSIQPESRAIIIENIKGELLSLKKRVFRF